MQGEHLPSAKGLKVLRRSRLARGGDSVRAGGMARQRFQGAKRRESRGRAGSVRGREAPLRNTCGRCAWAAPAGVAFTAATRGPQGPSDTA
eukprot:5256523-Pleurochrysis_carterae.AAC.1